MPQHERTYIYNLKATSMFKMKKKKNENILCYTVYCIKLNKSKILVKIPGTGVQVPVGLVAGVTGNSNDDS